jgi:hypothetical protein
VWNSVIIIIIMTVGVHFALPYRNVKDFPLFTVNSSCEACPLTRRASASNTICKYIDIFSKLSLHLIIFLKKYVYEVSNLFLY